MTKKALANPTVGILTRFCLALAVGLALSMSAHAQILSATSDGTGTQRHKVDQGKVEIRINVTPGKGKPSETSQVEVVLYEKLETPDARYGNMKPIAGASVTGYLVASNAKGKARSVTARKAIEFEDEGVYGFALTLDQVGVHALHVVVKSESHGKLNATVPLASDVWPIPEDAKLPALPRKLPIAGLSDVRHGRTLCATFCSQALDFAAPQGQVPQHLGGNELNALADGDVLAEVVDPKKLGRLNPIERNDLFHHILRLGTSVKAFFPDAAHVIPADVELNDYALERLEASLGIDPAEEDIESTVFVVYRGEGKTLRPAVISADDLVARDQLDKTKKVGYVIFFSSPNSPDLFELGIGLAKEPSYAIVGAVARTATGVKSKLQSQLNKLRGQGRFNDARSIKSGTNSFKKLITPFYLRAAEFATMYFAEEREMAAFD